MEQFINMDVFRLEDRVNAWHTEESKRIIIMAMIHKRIFEMMNHSWVLWEPELFSGSENTSV